MDETDDKIAIVGIGCNFPGGEGIDNFWKVLVEGRNCTVEIPAERFDIKHWWDTDSSKPGKTYTSRAALVDGFNEFDNKLFGIHNSEAENMDPQHKLLLECTYRALEDAGYPMERVNGTQTGVFIGLMNRDFDVIDNNAAESINHFNGTGTATSIAANRISYCFNLTGPSLAIDTACSSSLVALHYACQAIKNGDCEMAVCGGVSCIIEPRVFVTLSKAKMISPDGLSKPFSKKADGYGRGEGCGIIILKSLGKAKEDNSKVWGVICASAVNQDGKSVTPLTKPSQRQQEALLKTIYSIIDPSTVQYVEAHGTGTPVGDPVEAASIGNIIGKNRPTGSPLKIGSVKGNIGHTESASGVAGLIKVLLMMHHEVIPPSLYYSKDLGIIQIEEANLTIPITPEKWTHDGKLGRVASINSFGFGGTNVHVVLKQHKQNSSKCLSKRPVEIFVVSAASSKSLQLTIEDTKQQLNKVDSLSLENLVYTSACRRSHRNFKFRKAFLASSLKHLQEQLAKANNESFPAQRSPELVFVFCGNGLLYKGMCKMLLRSEPVFRKKCIEIDELLQVYTSLSMVKLLESEFDDFSRPDIAQLLLFTIQTSLVALLRHWGVKPDTIVGHSVGEVAAAHCSGLLSLQDAVKVIYYRSTLQSKVTGGKMLVVSNIPVTEISTDIRSYGQRINMAAYNSPTSCTVSGDAESIVKLYDQLNQQYSKRNIFLHLLDVPAAYHSHMMDPILAEIEDKLQNLEAQTLETDIISTVTGLKASKGDFTTGGYWARNIREPVECEQAIKSSITGKQNPVFIEIGPKRALQRYIVDILGESFVILRASMPFKEYETIFSILVKLFQEGYNPDWCKVYETYTFSPAALPRYQFDHMKQDVKFEKIRQGNQGLTISGHPLIHHVSEDFMECRCTISKAITPYIYEHKNNGSILVPGSFYMELGLAAASFILKPKVPLNSLEINITFSRPCLLTQDSIDLTTRLKQEEKVTYFEILSSHVYASGEIRRTNMAEEKRISLLNIFKRCSYVFEQEKMYQILSKFGFEYGKVYKELHEIHYGQEFKEGIAGVTVSEEITGTIHEYCIHPVVLDYFLQMLVIVTVGSRDYGALFPSSIGSLIILRPLQEKMFIYIKVIKITKNDYELCGCFTDHNGCILVEIKHAKLTSVKQALQENDCFFQNVWKTTPGLTTKKINSKSNPSFLVFGDNYGVSQKLMRNIRNGLKYVSFINWESSIQLINTLNIKDKDALFMWGIDRIRLQPSDSNTVSQYLAKCCETYRQVILAVRQQNSGASIRTVTFRTVENTVDHINPGFALVGMTRSCAAEMPDITFQLIDISSSNADDVEALAHVLSNYEPKDYPEVWIHEGQIYISEIFRTKIIEETRRLDMPLKKSDNFTLYTADPYKVTELSAEINKSNVMEFTYENVEVQIDQLCSHTEDFFPVSFSSWQFGNSLYWSSLSTENHKLLTLDFTGTVTAVGKHVKKLKVGDRIATCYPTIASSRATLPEAVCYSIKKVPILKKLPCVSHFILAWEVFHQQLPQANSKSKLVIVCTNPKSVLCMILANAAKSKGWEPTISSNIDLKAKQCNAMIILPSSKTISLEDISQLSLLQDIVIIQDRRNKESFQTENGYWTENTYIHLLNPATIFQKAYINEIAKDLYKWLQSIHTDVFLSLQHTVTLSGVNGYIDDERFNYFTCQSLPVIDLDQTSISGVPLSIKEETLFKHDAVYIVTGGLTGLGFETVKFIVQNDGGHVVILSRRSLTHEMHQGIAKIQNEQADIKITAIQCDITSYSEVMEAINSIQKIFPNIPIKGIFHSAVVLHDGILESLNLSLFEKVLRPKVDGAINLHHATIKQELDYFVCYSSVASFVGNAAQANYAASNSFLDIFCQYRRNMGLSGQSINWGAINLGLLHNRDNLHKLLQARGILLFTKDDIHTHLKKCLRLNTCQQGVVKFDFQTLQNNWTSRISTLNMRLSRVVAESISNASNTTKPTVSSKCSDVGTDEYVLLIVSELTSVSSCDITPDTLLNSLGIDSMLGMTLQSRIFQDKNLNIPLVRLLDPSTTLSTIILILKLNVDDSSNNEETTSEDTSL
ncbi:uncharacterized protein LOC134609475 [Pelobates fuscus]|uniref:uncharacterized protein LOC134609475 n=1 Tax=Pelobates fuscus TaxID=191477 RepID=UPI002FE42E23